MTTKGELDGFHTDAFRGDNSKHVALKIDDFGYAALSWLLMIHQKSRGEVAFTGPLQRRLLALLLLDSPPEASIGA